MAQPAQVLVVCTGNICRSPMAAALLQRRLAERGVAADVTSAGLLYENRGASEGAIATMAARGIDLSGHRSRVVSRAMVAAADLIVTMEPRHVREVVALHDPAWHRAFTLLELLQRSAVCGAREPGEALAVWLGRAGSGRRRTDLLGDDDGLAILDPYRQDQLVYDATASDLDVRLALLVDRAWPSGVADEPQRLTAV